MKKLKVVQFEGLAPSVFCGMYFADQGAEVILVAKPQSAPFSLPISKNIMNRNKKCITINLKDEHRFQLIQNLLSDTDILIDPYRPGVLEKLKLGPKELYQINKRIILLRVSGYGQSGERALRPGHDLNYLSVSGILPLINQVGQHQFPTNYLADFASASLGITGTLAALTEREQTGLGRVVDCSLADGCTYYAQKLQAKQSSPSKKTPIVRVLKIEDKTFLYNTKNGRILKQKQLLNQMKTSDYYRSKDGDVEISLVKQIDPLEGNKLVNPFRCLKLPNKIKQRGEDDNEVLGKLRAKL